MKIFTILLCCVNVFVGNGFLRSMYGFSGMRRTYQGAALNPDDNDAINKKWIKNKEYEKDRRYRKSERRKKILREKRRREAEGIKLGWKSLEKTLIQEGYSGAHSGAHSGAYNDIIYTQLDDEFSSRMLKSYDDWIRATNPCAPRSTIRDIGAITREYMDMNEYFNDFVLGNPPCNGKRADDLFNNETKKESNL